MDRATELHRGRIPFSLKIASSAYIFLMAPIYWHWYGPANFLWFCDFALLLTCVALWLESPLIASVQAIAVALPLFIWILDFVAGSKLVGVSRYMFDSGMPLYLRALSTFHIWLPVLLIWMLWRLGYDRRAWIWQSAIVVVLLAASYAFTNPAHPPNYRGASINVNRVYGIDEKQAQHKMNPILYLLLQMVFWPVCFYLPTHMLFRRVFLDPTMTAARDVWLSNHSPPPQAAPDAHASA